MNNKNIKILLPVLLFAILAFLFGIPYIDNSAISDKISLLKSNVNQDNLSTKFNSKDFTNLPLIVKKYLSNSIKEKSKNHITAHITLRGKTRLEQNAEWLETKKELHYSMVSPTYIELSEISTFFPIWKKTINTLKNGKASTTTKLLSSIKTNEFSGNKLNRSFLVKYLMESFMAPTTLFPNKNIHWKRVNNYSAKAIIWDEDLKGSAVFHFNNKNEVTKIISEDRYMPGKLDYTKEKITIHLANYKNIGDYYIPTYFELQWNLAGNNFTFARFNISNITYE